MNWANVAVLGFFVSACIAAVYGSIKEGWPLSRRVGTVVFLVGAAIGLFLDNFLSLGSAFLLWVEPIGAVIMIGGFLVSWFWQSQ
jgi:hypothetical protein